MPNGSFPPPPVLHSTTEAARAFIFQTVNTAVDGVTGLLPESVPRPTARLAVMAGDESCWKSNSENSAALVAPSPASSLRSQTLSSYLQLESCLPSPFSRRSFPQSLL